jgi:hypothetical protein
MSSSQAHRHRLSDQHVPQDTVELLKRIGDPSLERSQQDLLQAEIPISCDLGWCLGLSQLQDEAHLHHTVPQCSRYGVREYHSVLLLTCIAHDQHEASLLGHRGLEAQA